MRKFLLTTALVLPLGTGMAFAQATTTPAAPTAGEQAQQAAGAAADNAATAVEKTGEAAGDAAKDAADATGDAAKDAADATADAAKDAGQAAENAVTPTPDAPAADAAAPATDAAAPAADAAAPAATTDAPAAPPAEQIVRDQAAGELRVEWITGATVESEAGDKIGDIKDLIMDDQGQITAAILGVGGFLGIGEKQIAVNWTDLTIDYDGQKITTGLTKEQAQEAPAYVFREKEEAPAPVAPAADTAAPADSTMPATDAAAPADSTMPATDAAAPAADAAAPAADAPATDAAAPAADAPAADAPAADAAAPAADAAAPADPAAPKP